MMMFADIIKYVEEKEYQLAVDALTPLLKNEDEKIVAKAHHILGYINTRHDYTEKSDYQAKRHLRFNLNSNYPHPYGYVLYSQVEEDSNVALNYLEKGVARFPQDARILLEYFRLAPNKNAVIQIVKERNVNDARLLSAVIDYLVSVNQWNDVCHFAVQLENGNNLCESEQNYLDLIKAYAGLFSDSPDYSEAQRLLEKVIRTDTDNNLAYSHYLGIIYANLKLGRVLEATEFFDRIPVSNAVTDLDEWAQPLWISISFETLYPIIFKSILSTFAQDSSRKVKANVLYCLYLYSPSESYDIHRYKKSDVATLTRYLKTDFNKKIAVAVYRMRCHFKQFEDAYDILWEFLVRHQDPEESEIYFSETLENMSDDEVCRIARKTIEYLENDEWAPKQFVPSVFGTLVERLHDIKQYDLNRGLAEYLPLADILKSGHAFECAYAYAEKEQPRAMDIYEAIVKREPNNSSAINNLGVRYEHAGDLYKALDCYERAVTLAPNDKIHQNNLTRRNVDQRLAVFAELERASRENIGISGHKRLIQDSINVYAQTFLPGYIPLFTDFADGDRVTEEERAALDQYGIVFGTIDDMWPDAILYNPAEEKLWFIEAVTSDGEADLHKVEGLQTICNNSGKIYGGTTTTYETWKCLASRQQSENNLAPGTYIWIRECPNKHFKVC